MMDKTIEDKICNFQNQIKAPAPRFKSSAPPKTKAQLLFQGQKHPKKQKKIVRLEQWVEVCIVDGKPVTTLYPSNDKLIQDGQKMWPPPEFVYRRINFPEGVPDEYRWTNSQATPERLKRGGCGIQRMTVDTWLNVIEREKLRGDGHIGPTGVGNLPRPQETGGCNCPTCTRNQAILDRTQFVP
jgi:hypothetical protein